MILIDTNVLIALVDERDHLHAQALSDLSRTAAIPLFTPLVCVSETLFLLEEPYLRDRLDHWFKLNHVTFVSPISDDSLYITAQLWLKRYADHSPDFADALLCSLASLIPHAKIWSYDKEFRTIWRRLDGSRLPLLP